MKKKYIVIMIILIILLSALLFFKLSKPQKKEIKEEKQISVTPKEDLNVVAEKLLEKINNYNLDYYSKYEEMNFNEENEENTLLASYAYSLDKNEGKFNKEVVDKYYKEVFNTELDEHKDLKCYAGDGILYKFDTSKNEYIEDCGNIDELCHSHGGLITNRPLFVINRELEKEENEYTISVNQIYGLNVVDSDGYFYSDNEYKNRISDLDSFLDNTKNVGLIPDISKVNIEEVKKYYNDNYEKYKNNLPIYKYTFKKESDDFYLIKFKKQVSE